MHHPFELDLDGIDILTVKISEINDRKAEKLVGGNGHESTAIDYENGDNQQSLSDITASLGNECGEDQSGYFASVLFAECGDDFPIHRY